MRHLTLWTAVGRWALLTLVCALPLGASTVAHAQSNAGWARCAGQDEICRFPGNALVRYGIDGHFAYKVATNRIICDDLEFGDPALGQIKQCEFNPDVKAMPVATNDPNGWIPCAREGGTCSFSGNARVRFGANRRWVYRNATNSVHCSVGVFGDPAFGSTKSCDYQLYGAGGAAANAGGWEYCAAEGGICSFSGTADVRYGIDGRFVTKRASNGLPCTVEAFGSDPYYGQRKQCSVRTVRP